MNLEKAVQENTKAELKQLIEHTKWSIDYYLKELTTAQVKLDALKNALHALESRKESNNV